MTSGAAGALGMHSGVWLRQEREILTFAPYFFGIWVAHRAHRSQTSGCSCRYGKFPDQFSGI